MKFKYIHGHWSCFQYWNPVFLSFKVFDSFELKLTDICGNTFAQIKSQNSSIENVLKFLTESSVRSSCEKLSPGKKITVHKAF